VLPNLLIIGAGKCGTTSLHEYLSLHPEIYMSDTKELMFFNRDDWRDRLEWYEAQFRTAPVRGESSPHYTMFPFVPSTPERIGELLPDARLIYVVRDPIERAIASYVELVALRLESRTISDALGDAGDPANPHLCPSRYATQLMRFRDHFPADQILVLDHGDLLHDRARTLEETFRFLRVDPTFTSRAFEQRHNPREIKVAYGNLGFWLVKHGIFTRRNARFDRGPLIAPLRRLLSKPIDRRLPEARRVELTAAFRPEIDRLRELTGKPFTRWESFPPPPPSGGAGNR
jgi:hypothetical protein